MAVQFFFKEPEKDNIGEVLSSGYKAGMEARSGQIKKDLDATYNEHVVTEPQYDAAGNVTARPGDLNSYGFIKTAQERGLPMQESMQYLAHQKALRDAQLDQAQTETNIRDLGYDPSPSVTGRAGASIGDPNDPNKNYTKFVAQQKEARDFASGASGNAGASGASGASGAGASGNGGNAGASGNAGDSGNGSDSNETPPAPPAPPAPQDKPLTADDVWEHIKANKKDTGFIKQFQNEVGTKADGKLGKNTRAALDTWFKAQQAVPDVAGSQTPQVSADGIQMDLGSGVIHGSLPEKPEEAKLQAPEDWTGGYVAPARVPDTRTAGQAVQDTYSPQVASMDTGVADAVADAEANGVFDWKPVDDDSNEFRKYNSTLGSHLKSAGMVDAKGNPDPSKLLKELYTSVYNQNLSAKPDTRLRALGPEGRKAYIVAEAEYKASQIKAAGLARKAVLEHRLKLSEEANKYGVQTNDSTEENRKKEKHEADLGGRRAGRDPGSVIIRTRAVSETEKTRGEAIGNAYLDLQESKALGGFEGDYAGAMAKAKSDGNVNADVITGHLISMGAFPSEKSAYIKQMLSAAPQDAWNAVLKKVFAELGKDFYTDDAKRAKWYASAENNMKDAMRQVGYGVLGPKKEGRTAKDDLDDALGKKTKAKKPEDTPTKKYKDNGDILVKNPNGAGFTKSGRWK